jgi:hypothetical protein
MAANGNLRNFLAGESKPYRHYGFAPTQFLEGAVVIASAVAEAVETAIERQQRHQQNIGIDGRRGGQRFGNTKGVRRQPVVRFMAAKQQDLPLARHYGQRKYASHRSQGFGKRRGVDLAAESYVACNHGMRRKDEFPQRAVTQSERSLRVFGQSLGPTILHRLPQFALSLADVRHGTLVHVEGPARAGGCASSAACTKQVGAI